MSGDARGAAEASSASSLIVWRICRTAEPWIKCQPAARWHDGGREVVYASLDPSTALLEALAHRRDGEDEDYELVRIRVPPRARCQVLCESSLPGAWRCDQRATRAFGNQWFDAGTHALLRVPSALCMAASNVLLNGNALDWNRADVKRIPHPIDPRLVRRLHACGNDTDATSERN